MAKSGESFELEELLEARSRSLQLCGQAECESSLAPPRRGARRCGPPAKSPAHLERGAGSAGARAAPGAESLRARGAAPGTRTRAVAWRAPARACGLAGLQAAAAGGQKKWRAGAQARERAPQRGARAARVSRASWQAGGARESRSRAKLVAKFAVRARLPIDRADRSDCFLFSPSPPARLCLTLPHFAALSAPYPPSTRLNSRASPSRPHGCSF